MAMQIFIVEIETATMPMPTAEQLEESFKNMTICHVKQLDVDKERGAVFRASFRSERDAIAAVELCNGGDFYVGGCLVFSARRVVDNNDDEESEAESFDDDSSMKQSSTATLKDGLYPKLPQMATVPLRSSLGVTVLPENYKADLTSLNQYQSVLVAEALAHLALGAKVTSWLLLEIYVTVVNARVFPANLSIDILMQDYSRFSELFLFKRRRLLETSDLAIVRHELQQSTDAANSTMAITMTSMSDDQRHHVVGLFLTPKQQRIQTADLRWDVIVFDPKKPSFLSGKELQDVLSDYGDEWAAAERISVVFYQAIRPLSTPPSLFQCFWQQANERVSRLQRENEDLRRRIERMEVDEGASSAKRAKFSCEVCRLEKPIDELFVMTTCEHQLCRDCVTLTFSDAIRRDRMPLYCPRRGCGKIVLASDAELVLSDDDMRKYHTFELAKETDSMRYQHDGNNHSGGFGDILKRHIWPPLCNKTSSPLSTCPRCGNVSYWYSEWRSIACCTICANKFCNACKKNLLSTLEVHHCY